MPIIIDREFWIRKNYVPEKYMIQYVRARKEMFLHTINEGSEPSSFVVLDEVQVWWGPIGFENILFFGIQSRFEMRNH